MRERYSEVDAIVVSDHERLSRNAEQYQTLVQEMTEHNVGLKAKNYKDFQSELEILVQQWGEKIIQDKRDFVNLFVEEAVLEFLTPHWVCLTIIWSIPEWNDDILYIYRPRGACAKWTDTERAILREHYATDGKIAILQLLPDRSWESIIHEAMQMKIVRPRPTKNERCPVPTGITWQDYQFTQSMGWEPLTQGTIHAHSCAQIAYTWR